MDSFKNYLFLWLFIIPTWTTAGADGFTPLGRFRQSSALVGNKLYFFGSSVIVQSRDNIILDVTLSTLNTSNPLWFLSNSSVPTNSAFASACVGGPYKNMIYLLEHLNTTNDVSNNIIVYALDTISGTWIIPIMSGTIPVSRQQFQAINDANGKIYMFGGFKGFMSPNSGGVLNDINILDTFSLTWIQGSNVSAPTSRADFSATLLKNGLILYLGGGDNINMAEIPIYDTYNNSWSKMIATGDSIDPRSGHTAVLSPDGHVIIYGGSKNNATLDQSQQIASLDTTLNPYKWSVKSMIGNNVPPPLVFHSATIVGNFMILAFGQKGVNNAFDSNDLNSQLYILDTRNYVWVTSTNTSTNSPNPQNPSVAQIQTVIVSNSNSLSTGVIVAIPIISNVLIAIAGFIGYWLFKKNERDDIVRIAGSKNTA
ncbi:galactose oxidase [Gigaspora margarita]|uniref:Galactose oxidase n=1 Tax=Gigaspora margarita TaxID=4874 RepID=A0A8H4A8U7_GIGMA|nr:galactose oxidase [Gigaspora margarita]